MHKEDYWLMWHKTLPNQSTCPLFSFSILILTLDFHKTGASPSDTV